MPMWTTLCLVNLLQENVLRNHTSKERAVRSCRGNGTGLAGRRSTIVVPRGADFGTSLVGRTRGNASCNVPVQNDWPLSDDICGKWKTLHKTLYGSSSLPFRPVGKLATTGGVMLLPSQAMMVTVSAMVSCVHCTEHLI